MRASLVMPLERDNAWHRVMAKLPQDERRLLDSRGDLNRPELEPRAIFAGCNLQIMPFMASPALLGDIPVFGREDLCCGEVYYRMGAFDKVATRHTLRRWPRKVVQAPPTRTTAATWSAAAERSRCRSSEVILSA